LCLITTKPLYGFHAQQRPFLAYRANEGRERFGRSIQTAICKEESHVQADQLRVGSIHFVFDSLLSVSAMGQFEVAPDHFDSSSKKEPVRHTATKSRVKHKVSAGAQADRRRRSGASQPSASTTARAHASTKEIHPKTTAALRPK
jgi:hypothetical protein